MSSLPDLGWLPAFLESLPYVGPRYMWVHLSQCQSSSGHCRTSRHCSISSPCYMWVHLSHSRSSCGHCRKSRHCRALGWVDASLLQVAAGPASGINESEWDLLMRRGRGSYWAPFLEEESSSWSSQWPSRRKTPKAMRYPTNKMSLTSQVGVHSLYFIDHPGLIYSVCKNMGSPA